MQRCVIISNNVAPADAMSIIVRDADHRVKAESRLRISVKVVENFKIQAQASVLRTSLLWKKSSSRATEE